MLKDKLACYFLAFALAFFSVLRLIAVFVFGFDFAVVFFAVPVLAAGFLAVAFFAEVLLLEVLLVAVLLVTFLRCLAYLRLRLA